MLHAFLPESWEVISLLKSKTTYIQPAWIEISAKYRLSLVPGRILHQNRWIDKMAQEISIHRSLRISF